MCRKPCAARPNRPGRDVAPDEFGEGILSVLPGVAREQFHVGVGHVWKHIGADRRNPPENLHEASETSHSTTTRWPYIRSPAGSAEAVFHAFPVLRVAKYGSFMASRFWKVVPKRYFMAFVFWVGLDLPGSGSRRAKVGGSTAKRAPREVRACARHGRSRGGGMWGVGKALYRSLDVKKLVLSD